MRDPPDAAADAEWFDVTAWQGGGLVVAPLERTGPGLYRTTEPIPVHGNWKAMIRLHDESSLTALPIYLPRDEAIPVGEVPAQAQFTRSFSDEHQLLQREAEGGCPPSSSRSPIRPSPRSRCRCSPSSPGACTGWQWDCGRRRGARRLKLRGVFGLQQGGGR